MSLTNTIRRFIIIFVVLALAIATIAPWGLYWIGLYGVNGRPELPASSATQLEKENIYRMARGTGEPIIIPITPHEYIYAIYENEKLKPGILVAWRVASQYNLDHLKYKGSSWWHLSGTALTIWLTRNWSSDQILSKAAEINIERDKSRITKPRP